jgi:hypothetical protein
LITIISIFNPRSHPPSHGVFLTRNLLMAFREEREAEWQAFLTTNKAEKEEKKKKEAEQDRLNVEEDSQGYVGE